MANYAQGPDCVRVTNANVIQTKADYLEAIFVRQVQAKRFHVKFSNIVLNARSKFDSYFHNQMVIATIDIDE